MGCGRRRYGLSRGTLGTCDRVIAFEMKRSTQTFSIRRIAGGLILVAGVGGCASPRMAVPANLGQASDEIVVTNRSRASSMFVNEGFTMGPYQIVRVHRGFTSGDSGGWQVGNVSSGTSHRKGFYDFDVKAPMGMYKGQCSMHLSEKSTQFGGAVFGGAPSQGLECNCSGGGPGVTSVSLESSQQFCGVVTPRGGGAYPLQGIVTTDDGRNSSAMGGPIGYEVRGPTPIGAVEVVDKGRIWMSRALDAGARADLACLFVGLLLYRPADMQTN
jgi:hypothetical protein